MGDDPSRINATTDVAGGEVCRRWSNLPDLILHSVAMRLSGPANFSAFCGVCKDWRTAAFSTIADSFFSTMPPLFLFFSDLHYSSTSIYCLQDDAIYRSFFQTNNPCNNLPCLSNGRLICFDMGDRTTIVSIINPLTGILKQLPVIDDPDFQFVVLSQPLISPDCRLMIFGGKSFSSINVQGGSEWILHEVPSVLDAIFFHGRLYITLLDETDPAIKNVLEYDLEEKRIKRKIASFSDVYLMVCSEDEELLMVSYNEDGMEVAGRLLPRTGEEDQKLGCNSLIDWPGQRKRQVFLNWQRSDIRSFILETNRKKYDIDIKSRFWKICLEKSTICSNGYYYLSVGDEGKTDLFMVGPFFLA